MNIALWVAQGILALMFGLAGFSHGYQMERARTQAQMLWTRDRSDGFLRFLGTAEILGALGMILPIITGILPWLTPLAAVGFTVIQLLAIFTVHLPRKEYNALPMNFILLALSIFVVWGRWGLFNQ